MGREEKLDQIAGILTKRDIGFSSADDGRMVVRVGSSGVFINVAEQDDETIVSLNAPLALGMNLKGRKTAAAMAAANSLNRDAQFVRYVVYEGDGDSSDTFQIEAELLGSNMQGTELMATIGILANAADDLDDQVVADMGGQTLEDLWADEDDEDMEV